MQKDAYYFSHDSNARSDLKIKAMRCEYGSEGYGWYWILVELMREQADYRLRINGKYTLQVYSDELGTSSEKAAQFIQDCISSEEEDGFGLFESDGTFFWSVSLLRRMEIFKEKRQRQSEAGKKGAERRWGTHGDPNGGENMDPNGDL